MHIVAGKYKGIRLGYPKNIRPTSQKVREAIFSKIAEIVEGASVLDLYAGSGALAIEALSRGAKQAVFVDSSMHSITSIKKNLARCEVSGQVVRSDAFKFLSKDKNSYDLVLIDPPYGSLERGTLEKAAAHLNAEGRIVVEVSKREELPEVQELKLVDIKKYGDTLVGFYERSE